MKQVDDVTCVADAGRTIRYLGDNCAMEPKCDCLVEEAALDAVRCCAFDASLEIWTDQKPNARVRRCDGCRSKYGPAAAKPTLPEPRPGNIAEGDAGAPSSVIDGGTAALVAYVREQLGDAPWVQIAEAISDALREDGDREFTLPDLVQFAEERGFAWRDVHVVVEKSALAPGGFLQRVFLSLASDPPAVVSPAEVARKLRKSLDDPGDGRKAWLAWARGIKVAWRRSPPARNPDRGER